MMLESFVPGVDVAKGEGIRVKCEGWAHAAGKHAINLMTVEGDIALHWNPRIHERPRARRPPREVVRNSLKAGEKWAMRMEERRGGWPLGEEDGAAFTVDFINGEESWEVFVNGEPMPDFNFLHRILQPIVSVEVSNLEGPQILLLKPLRQPLALSTFAELPPPVQEGTPGAACDAFPDYMEIVCEGGVLSSPCPMGGGIRVTCDGWDKQQEQLSICLKSADNYDVLLWSPRIWQAAQALDAASHHLILRNTRRSGEEWQDAGAETDGTWPLGQYGSRFSVEFMLELYRWRISVAGAGAPPVLYAHRIQKPVVSVELENVTNPLVVLLQKPMSPSGGGGVRG